MPGCALDHYDAMQDMAGASLHSQHERIKVNNDSASLPNLRRGSGIFIFLALSGLIPWLARYGVISQWILLLHIIVGLAAIAPLTVVLIKHGREADRDTRWSTAAAPAGNTPAQASASPESPAAFQSHRCAGLLPPAPGLRGNPKASTDPSGRSQGCSAPTAPRQCAPSEMRAPGRYTS